MPKFNIKRGNTTIASVICEGSQNIEAMGVNEVTMKFTLITPVVFEVGDWCEVYNNKYVVYRKPEYTKVNERQHEYDLYLVHEFYKLQNSLLMGIDKNATLNEKQFYLTGNLKTFADLVLLNANRNDSGWVLGTVDSTGAKTLQFDGENILSSLNRIAAEFETEFWIEGRTISLTKRLQNSGITLSYGENKGLISISKGNKDANATIFTRLFVEGSEKNLPPHTQYGYKRLQLPAADNGKVDNASAIARFGIIEHYKKFDDVFPKHIGTVTAVGDEFTFFDTALPFNVNTQLLDKTTAFVAFQTGLLAGYNFNIAENGFDNAKKRFTILVNEDEKTATLPNATLKPAVGDKYIVFNIKMPQTHIDAASQELRAKALELLAQGSDIDFNDAFTGNCDPLYFKRNSITPVLGQYVRLFETNPAIDVTKRMSKIRRDLQNPDKYDITFTDRIEVNAVVREYLKTIEEKLVVNETVNRVEINREAVRRAAQRIDILRGDIFDPDGYFDAANFKPQTIEAIMATFGYKSGNLILENVSVNLNVGANANAYNISAGKLIHFVYDIGGGFTWVMPALTSQFTDSNSGYYIYAKCSKTALTGTWQASNQRLAFNWEQGYYWFLIGRVYPVVNGKRDIDLLYGTTNIIGNKIQTGIIQDLAGKNYINLDTGEASFTGRITLAGSGSNVPTKDEAQALADEAARKANEHAESITAASIADYNSKINALQAQVDGEVNNWFYAYTPSLTNYPANEWTTAEIKERHIGDTFTNIEQAPATNAGKSWRFVKEGTVFKWVQISDSDAVKALQNAATAQATADGKSTTYLTQPTKYAQGDTYILEADKNINGAEYKKGDVLQASQSSASWVAAHWVKAVRYTGDEAVNNLKIGGVNLLNKSHYTEQVQCWAYENAGTVTFANSIAKLVVGAVSGNPGIAFIGANYTDQTKLRGKTLTLTMFVKAPPGKDFKLHVYAQQQWVYVVQPTFTGNGAWQTAHVTFTMPDAGISNFHYYVLGRFAAGDTLEADWATMTIGNVPATDHAPSVSDTADAIADQQIYVEYSADGTGWHGSFAANDLYMRQKKGSGAWTAAIRIVGEKGASGSEGRYTDYQFAKNNSATAAPVSGWQDAPPAAGTGEYVWMRSGEVIPPATAPANWDAAIRLTGDKGDTGLQGVPGAKGADGQQLYTWVKYADTPAAGMSNSGTGKAYIGFAYNKTTATESNNYADYTWSLIKGDKGDTGVAGTPGANGQTLYTWIKYSDNADGTGLYDTPAAGTQYIGIAVNKTTAAESNNKADYTWSRFKGADGKSVTGVDVEFSKTTSATVAPVSGWQTTAPAWEQGKYIWSRTKTSYSDNTNTYSAAANLTGATGSTGGDGQPGRGIASVTEEYYLSVSKTVQTGGAWAATPPAWETGKYVWTRVRIDYTNPASTEYTTPVVSSEWEAVNNLKIGGDNLLRNSALVVFSRNITGSGTSELVTNDGEKYYRAVPDAGRSVSLYGAMFNYQAGYTYICGVEVRQHSGTPRDITLYVQQLSSNLKKTRIPSGVWTTVFTEAFTVNNNTAKYIILDQSGLGVPLEFKKIQIRKGNTGTEWSASPEDMAAAIAAAKTEAAAAANTYAAAQATAAKTAAQAYADGKVTAEEQARINADTNYLNAAKAYAEAQDAALKVLTESYADGKVTASEAAMIAVAEAKATAAKTAAQAYADGKVTAEEQRAIADAEAKLNAAKAYAAALDKAIEDKANEALTLAASKENTYIASATPTATKTGEKWLDLNLMKWKEWNGTAWVVMEKSDEITMDWLKKAFRQRTDARPGVILSSVTGMRDALGQVRSYISGLTDNPIAFAAGVSNFGMANETRLFEVRHTGGGYFANNRIQFFEDGTARIGGFYILNDRLSTSPTGTGQRMDIISGSAKIEQYNSSGNKIAEEGIINGVSQKIFYTNSGFKTASIGQNGVINYTIPESFQPVKTVSLTAALPTVYAPLTAQQKTTAGNYFAGKIQMSSANDNANVRPEHLMTVYYYNAGNNPESEGNRSMEGYKINPDKRLSSILPTGWYLIADPNSFTTFIENGIVYKAVLNIVFIEMGNVKIGSDTYITTASIILDS